MPDLPNRRQVEAIIREPLADLLARQRARLLDDYLAALEAGRPTPPAKAEESERMRVELFMLLALLLFGLHRAAAINFRQQMQATVLSLALITQERMDDVARQWAQRHAATLSRELASNTLEMLTAAYTRSVRQAAGDVAKAQQAFLETIEQILGTPRADRIAVTETTRGITAGESGLAGEVEKRLNVIAVPYWQTERDERVCPICAPLNDRPEAEWPQPLENGPPAHVNCRCFLDWRERVQT